MIKGRKPCARRGWLAALTFCAAAMAFSHTAARQAYASVVADDNIAISQVTDYVNVRTQPNTESEIVGRIYNDCAATILESVNGEGGTWYRIRSGSLEGFIKAQYFITGEEAQKLAAQIGTTFVTISADALRLREGPSLESPVLTMLSQNEEYLKVADEGEFAKIQLDSDMSGYVHKDYIKQRTELRQAVSLDEERARAEEAERLKNEAAEALARVERLKAASAPGTENNEAGDGASDTGNNPVSGTPAAGNDSGTSENAGGPGSPATEDKGSVTAPGTAATESKGSVTAPGTAGSVNDAASAGAVFGPGMTGGPGADAGSGIPGSLGADAGQGYYLGGGFGTTGSPGMTGGPGYYEGNASGMSGGPGYYQAGPAIGSYAPSPGSELASATRSAIVAYARQFIGNPYRYGGTSLTDGADCSGFTMKVFEHFGIDIGRSSRDQAENGRQVDLSRVQPGDLIFYASGDTINHVALYIGNGQIIHASTERTGIKVSQADYRSPCKAVTFLD